MNLPFFIVDVFTVQKYTGNQLAVFPDAAWLSSDEMQAIAREMHFSETTFIDPEDRGNHEYSVRVFTPEHEVPFAGHPVLGTAYIIRHEIIRSLPDMIVLSLPAGRIPVSFTRDHAGHCIIRMRQNPAVFSRRFTSKELATVLSLPEQAIDSRFPVEEVSTGLPFIIVPLVSREAVRLARINRDSYESLISAAAAKAIYLFCSDPWYPENMLNARMFADYYGVPEDPATGSGAGCLAAYLLKNRYFSSPPQEIRIEQGYEIHRPSLIRCRAWEEGGTIRVEVGGSVTVVAKGEFLY
jgi:trans-2,3-dihydro-3-hydroxyanthranilate isomerase